MQLPKTTTPLVERLRALDPLPPLVAFLLLGKVLWARSLVTGHALGTGVLADVVFLAVLWSLAASLRGRPGRASLALVSLLVSAGLLGIVVYASFFEQPPPMRALLMASQVRAGDDLLGSVTLRTLPLFADLPVLFWLASRPQRGRHPRRRVLLALLGFSLPASLVLTFVTAFVGIDSNPLAVAYRFGLLSFESASLLGDSLAPREDAIALEADLQAQIDGLTGHKDGPRLDGAPEFGGYAGTDVIVIQMEALQAGLIGARLDGEPVVPHLEELAASSHYFPNTYSQIGAGNTSDAEFIAHTSLLPPEGTPASIAYARKVVPSLPRLLSEKGYHTATFHPNGASFWNRFQLYPALGFDAYFDRTYFGDEDVIGYGPSDRILYKKTLPILVEKAFNQTNFYASLVSMSAHYPFRDTRGRGPIELPEDVAKTTTGRYLEAQSYADEQLGWFIDELEGYGLLDECILVIYGDHFGLRWSDETKKDRAIREELFGHAYNRADFYNVPLIVRLPYQEKGVVHPTVLGQVDIMPTIADLLGLDLSEVPHFGRSAFVDTPTVMTRPGALPITIEDDFLFIQGLKGKDDRFYASTTQEKLYIRQPVPERFDSARLQLKLCEEYAAGFPEREGATDAVGHIPKPGEDFR